MIAQVLLEMFNKSILALHFLVVIFNSDKSCTSSYLHHNYTTWKQKYQIKCVILDCWRKIGFYYAAVLLCNTLLPHGDEVLLGPTRSACRLLRKPLPAGVAENFLVFIIFLVDTPVSFTNVRSMLINVWVKPSNCVNVAVHPHRNGTSALTYFTGIMYHCNFSAWSRCFKEITWLSHNSNKTSYTVEW